MDRSRYRGVFAPGYQPLDADGYSPRTFHPVGLKAIDHIVANVEEGKMGEWVDYYSKIMGFSLLVSFDDKDISTEYSALMSKVVADGRGRIKFPINEPAKVSTQVADRGVPGLLRRAGCAAHRDGDRRHHLQRAAPWPPMTFRF